MVLTMAGIPGLFLWTVLIVHTGLAFGEIQFLERREGESVVLPCAVEPRVQAPFGVYLKRSWLHRANVLFMHTGSEFTVFNSADRNRTSVSGDPGSRSLNVTFSQLRVDDTDRYYCEFVVDNPSSEDIQIQGKDEFFLLVNADAPGSADIELVETCVGGSAVLPCLPSQGEHSVVEGVIVKRQRGRAPVEVLYHSKHHHSRSPPSLSSQFPIENIRLSLAPGFGGITYNVTLQQLQPDDSALYSCQLHVHGRSNSVASLGRRVFFVSVQGANCGCARYSTLLYALFAAVSVLVLLLLAGLLLVFKGSARRGAGPRPQAPIYEEMVGLQPPACKLAPNHLEETETCEYRNCRVKKSCPENHYERPRGAARPRSEAPN